MVEPESFNWANYMCEVIFFLVLRERPDVYLYKFLNVIASFLRLRGLWSFNHFFLSWLKAEEVFLDEISKARIVAIGCWCES